MKKFLALFLIVASLLLVACGPGYDSTTTIHGTPKNAVFDAPEEFYLDWDIPSVRDSSLVLEGNYSMPVYKFETYEELLHLKEIVDMDEIGAEIDNTDYCPLCNTSEPCDHDKYNEAFFEKYTLLIGWHQYEGVVIPEHVQNNPEDNLQDDIQNSTQESVTDESQNEPDAPAPIVAEYEVTRDGALVVYLQGEKSDTEISQQWVFVAVPKNIMTDCDSIAFFVELPQE